MDPDRATGDNGAKRFWNSAARENAAWYIATAFTSESAEFFASGAREVEQYLALAGVTIEPGAILVEVGCGTGRMTRHLATLAGRVKAVDISSAMLAGARKNLAGATNVDFVEVSGNGELPFDDDSVDAVFSYITMQHIPTAAPQLRYFAEALRITAPGGWVLIQFRRRGLVPRLLDWAGHLRHLLSGRRTINRAWRGARVSEQVLRSFAGDRIRIDILRPGRRHIWVLARVS